ncbi:MAG: hypothetical protein GY870_07525 [archaeon]|nr:hypothetical protein [archaeon]
MNKKDLDKIIDKIDEEAKKQKQAAYKEYAFSKKRFNIGEMIQYFDTKIIIESIKWAGMNYVTQYPACVYRGTKLRKDNKPFKSGEKEQIFEREGVVRVELT